MAQVIERSSTTLPAAGIGEDLRDWLEIADGLGDLQRVDDADWDLEIGGLTELLALDSKRPRALLFDHIKGFPPGYRVATNSFITRDLAATLLGIPRGLRNVDMTRAWRDKAKHLLMQPARNVDTGPVMENVLRDGELDLTKFPTPRWHENDGGRFIGTGCAVITRDPETGQINVGCYRMMLQDRDKVGLYISPGKHGRVHRDKYFAMGEPMPVAAVFGMHPLIHLAASINLPVDVTEYDWVGAVRGEPVPVIQGSITGLPFPASAEIVIEGYVDPRERLDEGPFGEWTGYYASAVRQEPYVQVKALYHRAEPILLGSPPMRPPGDNYHGKRTMLHALIWDALEGAGITDVKEVTLIPAAGAGMLVIAIKQRYEGHARQAAHIAAQSRAGAYLGRYVVVVDDDIDTENPDEVLWAIWTRSDPEESLDLVRHCWSTPLDPRIPPYKRERGDFGNSRLIIDATRPFHWREQFPAVSGISRQLRSRLQEKWGQQLLD